MAEIRADILTRVSAEGTSLKVTAINHQSHCTAAENFVDAYYTALQASRGTISSYYVPPTTLPDGKTVPVIVWNGNGVADGAAFQRMFEDSMPYTYYDVQSLDCDVLNTGLAQQAASASDHDSVSKKDAEKNLPVVVMVSGYVRLEEAREGPMRGFSETFVLVPNAEKEGKGKGSQKRAWLIQNQNFRYVT